MFQSLTFPSTPSSSFSSSQFQFLKPTLVNPNPNPNPNPLNRRRHQMVRCRGTAQLLAAPPVAAASFYEVLRVKQNASAVEIKAAYRSLAKLYHPDAGASSASSSSSSSSSSSPSDGRDFIKIHNAYETLSDPATRSIYDLSLGLGFRDRDRERERRSSSSFAGCYSVGRRPPTRRWETDQCW